MFRSRGSCARAAQRVSLFALATIACAGLLVSPAFAVSSWVSQDNPLRSNDIHATEVLGVDFVDQDTGWAVGYGPGIVRTIDGGVHWTLQTVPLTNVYDTNYTVHFADANAGWVGSTNGVFYTTNGGDHWDLATMPANTGVWALSFPDAAHGWGVHRGEPGGLVASSDAGRSWQLKVVPQATDPFRQFWSVSFTSSDSGWVCGQAGVIYHTANGGGSWTAQSSTTTNTLWAIQFVTPLEGWAVGDYTTILHTSDGGAHWAKQSSPVASHFQAVHFRDALSGWVVGTGGTCVYTTDGGATWTSDPVGTADALVGVAFPPTGVPFAVGHAFHIYKRTGGSPPAGDASTSITIKTNTSTTSIGKTPMLSGAVTPLGMVGKNIVVYVKKPGSARWTYSSNRTTYALGGGAAWQYKYYFKPGMATGSYAFKAGVPAWPGFLASTSPSTVSIRLR